jgi:hypothetical protein
MPVYGTDSKLHNCSLARTDVQHISLAYCILLSERRLFQVAAVFKPVRPVESVISEPSAW